MYRPLNLATPETFNSSSSEFLAVVLLLCVLSFILVLFSDLIPAPFGGYADQRFMLVAVSGLLPSASILIFAIKPVVAKPRNILVFLPTLLFCLAFIILAMPFSNQPYAWAEPGMYAFYFMAVITSGACLAWTKASSVFTRFFVLIISTVCLLYGLASINVYLFAIFDGVTNLSVFIPWGFVNIRYWSHVASWFLPLLPLAVLIGPLREFRFWRAGVLLGAGLWWWILFLTTARGSALGIAFGVAFSMALFGRRAFPWLRVFVIYIAVGVVVWLLLSILIPTMLSGGEVNIRSVHAGDSGRLPLFIEAWNMSLQNFPFGMGPQSWLTHERITQAYSGVGKLGHPHNMYLMWAAEYGWVLIAVLGLVLVQGVRCLFKCRATALADNSDEQVLVLAAFTTSVVAALIHAGVSAVFMAPGSMLVGLFVLITFWAQVLSAGSEQPAVTQHQSGSSLRIATLLPILIVVFAGWTAWAQNVWVYYLDMREDEELYHREVREGTLPRFWAHGNFPRV